MSDENVPKKCLRQGCTYSSHCKLYKRVRAAVNVYPQHEGSACPFYVLDSDDVEYLTNATGCLE